MKKNSLLLLLVVAFYYSNAQDVLNIKPAGILIDYQGGTTLDASAILQLNAGVTSNQGFLPPRVALTAANLAGPITLPATGLMVYNTVTANTGIAAPPNDIAPGYYYNAGISGAPVWTRFGAGSGSVIGGGTTNYLVKWVTATGLGIGVAYDDGTNLGIGTTVPTQKLEVSGAIKLGTTGTSSAGTVRWTGTDFEGWDGQRWQSLSGLMQNTLIYSGAGN